MQRKNAAERGVDKVFFYSIRLLAQRLFARFRPGITQAHGAVKD